MCWLCAEVGGECSGERLECLSSFVMQQEAFGEFVAGTGR